VLISAPGDDTGAENAGAAYLFSTNGTLLMNFTNPIPKTGASFGEAVATVDNNFVLIGARFADRGGAAYLFSTNGTLLTSFTNPTPASVLQFGSSVAAVGSDRVLIGAQGYQLDITNSGAAFLFSTNGTLLTTLTNPSPGDHLFGRSVAAVFHDKLVVGAPQSDPATLNSGSAYLFATNGSFLMSFTNPSPAAFDNFGLSLAAVGSDRVIVSAGYNSAVGSAGAAYLFDSSGQLLATFTSPAPEASAQFGYSVAAVGDERLLIGAPYDDAWTRAGAAYLFGTNGNSLVTFTNPTTAQYPNQYLAFGSALAAVGSDTVLIGSPHDHTGAMDTGAAYLFTIPPPVLQIRLTATNAVKVSWPSPAPGFWLQQNTNGIATLNWSNVTDSIWDDGTNLSLLICPPTGSRFYRLFKP
jgi:hypothetical protein